MAAAAALVPEEDLQCPICLELFTNPVSLPCGHNFCRSCITVHWKQQPQKCCPLCSHQFSKSLKLQVNFAFREIVDNFRKQQVGAAKSNPVLQPEEVPCDCCLHTKLKALKTCLVCLASFCETHLEAHYKVPALMSHKLSQPIRNLPQKICTKHMRMLDLFCKDDMTRCCDLCPEHRRHNTVPLEEEYQEKKSQLEKEKAKVEQMIREREKMMQEIKEEAQSQATNKDQAIANSAHTFSASTALIHRDLIQLHWAIQEKHRGVERRAEALVKELKKEMADLQRRSNQLLNSSQSQDPIQLITSFHTLRSPASNTKTWSSISLHGGHGAEAVNRALLQLEETLGQQMKSAATELRNCCAQILQQETQTETKPSQMVTDLETVPEGLRLDIIRQQYEVDMTFDPHSADDLLIFSKDLKEVQAPHLWWCSKQMPHKFTGYAFILSRRGFTKGRFYYEVGCRMKSGWDLGLIRESLRGKKQLVPSSRDGAWVLRLRNNTKLTALHHKPLSIALKKKPDRVGVFVDYEEGLVSFYDVDSSSLIYSFTGCSFNERIYPFFSPGPPDDGINSAPLVLSPSPCNSTSTTTSNSTSPCDATSNSNSIFNSMCDSASNSISTSSSISTSISTSTSNSNFNSTCDSASDSISTSTAPAGPHREADLQQYLQDEAVRFFWQAWAHPIDGVFWFLVFAAVFVFVFVL